VLTASSVSNQGFLYSLNCSSTFLYSVVTSLPESSLPMFSIFSGSPAFGCNFSPISCSFGSEFIVTLNRIQLFSSSNKRKRWTKNDLVPALCSSIALLVVIRNRRVWPPSRYPGHGELSLEVVNNNEMQPRFWVRLVLSSHNYFGSLGNFVFKQFGCRYNTIEMR